MSTTTIIMTIVIILIIIGVVIGIYFVAKGAFSKAAYNGGGSGDTGYIRTWIDKNANIEGCTFTSRYGKLITQDKQYYLCYNPVNSRIFLKTAEGYKEGNSNKNIWYFCFRNVNLVPGPNDVITPYVGTMVSLYNNSQDQQNAAWMCATQGGGNKKCSKTSDQGPKGNYTPSVVQLSKYCPTVDPGDPENPIYCTEYLSPTCGGCAAVNLPCAPCVANLGGGPLDAPYAVESSVYINKDDTISTIPTLSPGDGDGKGYMAKTYYMAFNSKSGNIYPSGVHKVALRFNIEDCSTDPSCPG